MSYSWRTDAALWSKQLSADLEKRTLAKFGMNTAGEILEPFGVWNRLDEERLLDQIKNRLRQNNHDIKAKALYELFKLQIGQCSDISWAAFHIIEVMSQPKFSQRRLAYLLASLSFHEGVAESVLATSLIKKAIGMTPYEVSQALHCLCSITTESLAKDTASDVVTLLKHSKPRVRKIACLTLYNIIKQFPDALRPCFPRLCDTLKDADPKVRSAGVQVICLLAKENPKAYVSAVAPKFFEILKSSTYDDLWSTSRIVQMFRLWILIEPKIGKRISSVLSRLMSDTSNLTLLYECILTIFEAMPRYGNLHDGALVRLRMFLESSDPNQKYVGLQLLERLKLSGKMYNAAVMPYKELILACLDIPDSSIRTRALEIFIRLISRTNIEKVINMLMEQLCLPFEQTDLAELQFKETLLQKVLTACSQDNYSKITDFHWYMGSVLFKAVRKCRYTGHGELLAHQILDITIRVKSVRTFVVKNLMYMIDEPSWFEEVSSNTNTISYAMRDGIPSYFTTICSHSECTQGTHHPSIVAVLYSAAYIIGEYIRYIELRDVMEVLKSITQTKVKNLPPSVQRVFAQASLKLSIYYLAYHYPLNTYVKNTKDKSVPVDTTLKRNENDSKNNNKEDTTPSSESPKSQYQPGKEVSYITSPTNPNVVMGEGSESSNDDKKDHEIGGIEKEEKEEKNEESAGDSATHKGEIIIGEEPESSEEEEREEKEEEDETEAEGYIVAKEVSAGEQLLEKEKEKEKEKENEEIEEENTKGKEEVEVEVEEEEEEEEVEEEKEGLDQLTDLSAFSKVIGVLNHGLLVFLNSRYLDVQERACYLREVVMLLNEMKGDGHAFRSIVHELVAITSPEHTPLNPVAPSAQRKVKLPPGLYLDIRINDPPSIKRSWSLFSLSASSITSSQGSTKGKHRHKKLRGKRRKGNRRHRHRKSKKPLHQGGKDTEREDIWGGDKKEHMQYRVDDTRRSRHHQRGGREEEGRRRRLRKLERPDVLEVQESPETSSLAGSEYSTSSIHYDGLLVGSVEGGWSESGSEIRAPTPPYTSDSLHITTHHTTSKRREKSHRSRKHGSRHYRHTSRHNRLEANPKEEKEEEDEKRKKQTQEVAYKPPAGDSSSSYHGGGGEPLTYTGAFHHLKSQSISSDTVHMMGAFKEEGAAVGLQMSMLAERGITSRSDLPPGATLPPSSQLLPASSSKNSKGGGLALLYGGDESPFSSYHKNSEEEPSSYYSPSTTSMLDSSGPLMAPPLTAFDFTNTKDQRKNKHNRRKEREKERKGRRSSTGREGRRRHRHHGSSREDKRHRNQNVHGSSSSSSSYSSSSHKRRIPSHTTTTAQTTINTSGDRGASQDYDGLKEFIRIPEMIGRYTLSITPPSTTIVETSSIDSGDEGREGGEALLTITVILENISDNASILSNVEIRAVDTTLVTFIPSDKVVRSPNLLPSGKAAVMLPFSVATCNAVVSIKASVSFIIHATGEKRLIEASVVIPCSAFIVPTPMHDDEFAKTFATLPGTPFPIPPSSGLSSLINASDRISRMLHLHPISSDSQTQYMCGQSAGGPYILAEIKQTPTIMQLTLKCSDVALAANLLSEVVLAFHSLT